MWSLQTMVIAVGVFIAVLGWMFCAAKYAGAVEGWRAVPEEIQAGGVGGSRRAARGMFFAAAVASLANFIGNSIGQIPDAPAVVGHNLRHTPWLPGIFVVLEVAVVGFAFMARKIERQHAKLDEITGG